MKKAIIFFLFFLFFLPCFVEAQEQDFPVGLYIRAGATGSSRADMSAHFSVGGVYDLSKDTHLGVALMAWKLDLNTLELGDETNLSLRAIASQHLFKKWFLEGNLGIDRVDYSEDASEPDDGVGGYGGIKYIATYGDLTYGLAIGTNYNFDLKKNTPMVSLVLVFR